ncbi:winged helix-turn-helix transcriptional regulator [Mucilaginibacter sp.]|jgi:DNA-binding HxlR family transcriptional regulator|uniref:winged helix-turn-helix transcriptional regulator n=1 Tax=Mucilaginibacter sp. TaxID=1882438 RepID=UPI0035699F65
MNAEINNHGRSNCPISHALDLFGDKWTLLIIRDIVLFGKNKFSEFLTSDERIATNIARNRLQKLTENGFLTKKIMTGKHWTIPYTLTEKAIDLVPLLIDLTEWGAKYGTAGALADLAESININKEKTIAEIQKKLRDQVSLPA